MEAGMRKSMADFWQHIQYNLPCGRSFAIMLLIGLGNVCPCQMIEKNYFCYWCSVAKMPW